MVDEVRVVVPGDMGKTIEFGTTEPDKWNIKHDDSLIIKADGSLSVNDKKCVEVSNLNDPVAGGVGKLGFTCFYKAIETRSANRNLVIGMPTNPIADEATQPALTNQNNIASAFVSYDQSKQYTLDVVGYQIATPTEIAQYVDVDGHFWGRQNRGGMHTNGSIADNNAWTDWKRLDELPQPPNEFDISNLPTVAWKKGTEVLVKQDGNLKLMKANESLFQEIGVGITANKTVGDIGDKYHLVVTVTNTGEDTNEMTLLDIIKPQLGNYTMSNFTNRASTGASVEKVTDTQYKVKKLAKGGTAIVEFDVTPNASGTFQFGASVNPNTALDMQSNNNQASIILSARIAANPDLTPSVECPLIDITYKGKKLVGKVASNGSVDIPSRSPVNVFVEKSDLKDVVFDIPQDVTLSIQGNTFTDDSTNKIVFSNGRYSGMYGSVLQVANPTDNLSGGNPVLYYTFVNHKLTFTRAYKYARIYVRPKGEHCKWQAFDIATTVNKAQGVTYTTDLPHSKVVKSNSLSVTNDPATRAEYMSTITVIDSNTVTPTDWVRTSEYRTPLKEEEVLTIKLPKGTVTTGYIDIHNGTFSGASTTGNLKLNMVNNGTRINVSTTTAISSADNLVYNGIKFEVV